MVVTATPVFPGKRFFISLLLKEHPEITTVLQSVYDREASLVLGDREKVLYGPGYIEDQLCGCRFRVSAASFYQVNPVQTEKLYGLALDYAGLTGTERVRNAYCGAGTIAIFAATRAGKVTGVELNPDAVRDAIFNAKRNGVKNCWFTRGDAGKFLEASVAGGSFSENSAAGERIKGKYGAAGQSARNSAAGGGFPKKNVAGGDFPEKSVAEGDFGEELSAAEWLPEKSGFAGERCDVVFMDPPRAGSDRRFLNALLHAAPRRVVYISCNPETLARDLTILTRGGYRAEKIRPVDMFPHTEHVETVVLMSRVEK